MRDQKFEGPGKLRRYQAEMNVLNISFRRRNKMHLNSRLIRALVRYVKPI